MTTANEQNQPVEPVKRTVFYDLSRKVLLAAIGAAAIASDELSGFVARLAERGEIAESDARNLIREVLDQREKLEKEQQEEKERQKAVAEKTEIDQLSTRIAELNKRIEELKKSKQAPVQEA